MMQQLVGLDLFRDQRQLLGTFALTPEREQGTQNAQHGGQRDRSDPGHRAPHGGQHLGSVDLGDQAPVCSLNWTIGGENRNTAIVDTRHDVACAIKHGMHGRDVFSRHGQAQRQRRTRVVPRGVEVNDVVAIAPDQQRLTARTGSRPLLQLREDILLETGPDNDESDDRTYPVLTPYQRRDEGHDGIAIAVGRHLAMPYPVAHFGLGQQGFGIRREAGAVAGVEHDLALVIEQKHGLVVIGTAQGRQGIDDGFALFGIDVLLNLGSEIDEVRTGHQDLEPCFALLDPVLDVLGIEAGDSRQVAIGLLFDLRGVQVNIEPADRRNNQQETGKQGIQAWRAGARAAREAREECGR